MLTRFKKRVEEGDSNEGQQVNKLRIDWVERETYSEKKGEGETDLYKKGRGEHDQQRG